MVAAGVLWELENSARARAGVRRGKEMGEQGPRKIRFYIELTTQEGERCLPEDLEGSP